VLQGATDEFTSVVVAIDRDGLRYGDEVVATIRHDALADYSGVAGRLAEAGVRAALIQHEYGIFGGRDGSHVLALASALTQHGIPYLVTLHTVLSQPSPGQLATLRALCTHAARVTVFTETARRMVVGTGIAANHQITVMPHGAPTALQAPPAAGRLRPEFAALLDSFAGGPTLTTFGLLSPGKGIDLAIDALAEVVSRHPGTRYVVAGATHPDVVRHAGESHRESLHAQVDRLGLAGQVHFLDDFLTEEELSALLHRTTLFVTPYLSPEQICSGALTFALAAGRPVVSSAYRYAEDMLRYGAGRVVPCGDAAALATAISDLLGDPAALAAATKAAESIGSTLTWPAVAVREAALIREVLAESDASRLAAQPLANLPALRLTHLERLTDEIGIIQFARADKPDYDSGYCVDDVARLAIVAAGLLPAGRGGAVAEGWVRQSVRFLAVAHDPAGRGMRNLLSYGGAWLDDPHFGDHVGRAMWALGAVSANGSCPEGVRHQAGALLGELARVSDRVADTGLRAGAYALLGLAYAQRPAWEIEPLVRRLDAALGTTCAQAPGWHWFEPELTYDNARLAQAMLAGATRLGDSAVAARAIEALDWYCGHVRLPAGTLRCVGNRWHRRDDGPPAWEADGDEQPIDAAACTEALVDAWRHTGDPRYARLAGWAFSWFLGRNRAGARLYDDRAGGCHDGLSATAANANLGAESTLAYYQALLSLVGGGLAELPAQPAAERERPAAERGRPASEPGRPVATRWAGVRSARPAATARPAPIASRPLPGNRLRTTEDPTDAR
jgi:glycosyltransferase involved in cell wall biosynthesis